MSNSDVFSMAVRNLKKRKLRTFLTLLGVVVSTCSIVISISLGISMNKTFEEQLSLMGDITLVTVYAPDPNAPQQDGGPAAKLDNNAIIRFQNMAGVLTATPVIEMWLYAKSGKYISNLQVIGVLPESMEALGYALADGRLLATGDTLDAVFGSEAQFSFYRDSGIRTYYSIPGVSDEERVPDVNVMTAKIEYSYDWRLAYPDTSGTSTTPIKTYRIKTIGLLNKKDDYRVDNSLFMPLRQAEKIIADQKKFEQQNQQEWGYGAHAPGRQEDSAYQTAYVKCTDLTTVKKIRDEIEKMGYPAYIPSQQLDSMERVSQSLQSLFGAIGGVALFVAAIVIINTMLMSVYERTREIGVMKVIGALLGDIRKLFLLEAGIIGFIGGAAGVLLSFPLSLILNSSNLSLMNQDYMMVEQSSVSTITPWLCALALVFATVVGLVSGYFPARRAMRISALTAIKAE